MSEIRENPNFTPLLKTQQVAELLGISKSFAYKLVSQRVIPHIKIGTAIRIRYQDLMDYIESNIESNHN